MSTSVGARPAPTSEDADHDRRGGRQRLLFLLALALLLLMGIASLAIGNQLIGPLRVVQVLFDRDGSEADAIVNGMRLPRTALLLTVGVALGVSGALMQGYTRNPLADPGLLGVEAGASLAVVLGIYLFGLSTTWQYTWVALVGAGIAAWGVFLLGSSRGGPNPTTLVLAGAAVSALCGALVSAVITSSVSTLDEYRFWVVGSASGRGFDVFVEVLPFIVVGLLLAVVAAKGVNLLQLGDDVATSLGVDPRRQKLVGIVSIMLLCGGAVAACGPIGFVGLVVPHVARAVVGVDYRFVVPMSGLIGGIVLTAADVLGRVAAGGAEIQVGIVMAAIGGPLFVLLVRRRRRMTT